jgi:phosphoenolpyruvate carboxylase
MDQPAFRSLENFKNHVGIKFQLYNSLFTSLPFHRIENTGILLSLFLKHCEEGFEKGNSPSEIVEDFFGRFTNFHEDREKTDLLFRFVQYVERQVVLFDALEDAAFSEVADLDGPGSLRQLEAKVTEQGVQHALLDKLSDFNISLVLTAHPTQFYPGSVLGIITDLSRALSEDHVHDINMYLRQLGKTPLFKKQKPTPFDEAASLVWYLENVFYDACGRIISTISHACPQIDLGKNPVVKMGFWPGGDRDGNRNVTTAITLKVADALRSGIIHCYYRDVRYLKRRLTFKGIDALIAGLEEKLYASIHMPDYSDLSHEHLLQVLLEVKSIIAGHHNGLFLELVDSLINKVHLFGLYFATLDIRQESSVHTLVMEEVAVKENLVSNYRDMDDAQKLDWLGRVSGNLNLPLYEDLVQDTLASFKAVKAIQEQNGERGCNRYIISQCNSAIDVMQVYALFLLNGWTKEDLTVDIVPLFETIEDLKGAPGIMKSLYELPAYRTHLSGRKNTQTIMVGFSDGTKDGGYMMANWSIYKAKEALTQLSAEYGIDVIFFDGRGGPPARGGGKTHKYYASMGPRISNKEIQLTVQGQTVSSNFGNMASAGFNMEQLLNAGITNALFADKDRRLRPEQEEALEELAEVSHATYVALKSDPLFMDYLLHTSPLKYYSETNISSRPAKRGQNGPLELSDLRAIPFVGAWSQIKQNVPGFYGLGTALQKLEEKGKLELIQHLYERSLYFKTLLDNCEMAMMKSFFGLTAFLSNHPKYGKMWKQIHEEFERTKKYLFLLSGNKELMQDYPVERLSIVMRERIVLPLTTIQQYALTRIREANGANDSNVFDHLVIRTSFGIINAGRNSV